MKSVILFNGAEVELALDGRITRTADGVAIGWLRGSYIYNECGDVVGTIDELKQIQKCDPFDSRLRSNAVKTGLIPLLTMQKNRAGIFAIL